MAGSLMLINPRARRRKSTKRRTTAKRRRNPIVANPRRRRRASAKRRRNPIGLARVHHARRRSHTRRRRNPIAGMGTIGDMVMNGLKGAVGSVAINAAVNFLPATLRSGNVLYVTRTGAAILLGTLGRKVLGRHARVAAEGALAVNFADVLNSFGAGIVPGSHLHGITATEAEQLAMLPGTNADMAAVIDSPGLGYMEPDSDMIGSNMYDYNQL